MVEFAWLIGQLFIVICLLVMALCGTTFCLRWCLDKWCDIKLSQDSSLLVTIVAYIVGIIVYYVYGG